MPVKDASGKRLSGQALVKRGVEKKLREMGVVPDLQGEADKAGNAAGLSHFGSVAPPPLGDVDACEAWANGLALLCATAAELGIDPVRRRVLTKAVGKIGKCKLKARVSSLACEARYVSAMEADEDPSGWKSLVTCEEPPVSDPIAAAAWAYFRLCKIAHMLCHVPEVEESRWAGAIDCLIAVSYVECTRMQRAIPRKK